MENKSILELLELLNKLKNKNGNLSDEWYEVWDALLEWEPFCTILNPDNEKGIPQIFEEIKELKNEIRKLKNHKHDKNGEVMV